MALAQALPPSAAKKTSLVLGGGLFAIMADLKAKHCSKAPGTAVFMAGEPDAGSQSVSASSIRLFGKNGFALLEMTANALKPKGVFGMIHVLSQSGEVWPDFKVTLIERSQMLSSGLHLFFYHLSEVPRPHDGGTGGNLGLE